MMELTVSVFPARAKPDEKTVETSVQTFPNNRIVIFGKVKGKRCSLIMFVRTTGDLVLGFEALRVDMSEVANYLKKKLIKVNDRHKCGVREGDMDRLLTAVVNILERYKEVIK